MRFKLKQFRNDHELHQSHLAKIIGLTQPGISRLEKENIADLSRTQMQRLYDNFNQEEIDQYIVIDDISEQPRLESQNLEELLRIIQNQNDIIVSNYIEIRDFQRKYTELFERLLNFIEKNDNA